MRHIQSLRSATGLRRMPRLVLLIVLFLTAGCHYPKMQTPSSDLPPENLRETLAALSNPTQDFGSTQPAIETPGPYKTSIPIGTSRQDEMFPDSEVLYSPTSLGFDLGDFIQQHGGYLSRHVEIVQKEQLSGTEIVERVALESFN